MPLTIEEYYRKAHICLETRGGRENIFRLFKDEIEEGLREGNISKSVGKIEILRSYLKGDSFIFLDHDLPNIQSLKEKKGEIKEDALKFMKDNIDLFKKVCLAANNAEHKFYIMALFIRFMPEINDLMLRHYTDLYLLMFHTMLSLDSLEGTEKDRFDLGDVILRASVRYDCAVSVSHFIRDIKLKGLLDDYTLKYTPNEGYIKRLKEAVRKVQISGSFNEDLVPLVLTDRLFYLFDELNNGLIKNMFLKNREVIASFINSRLNKLFEEKREDRDIINNEINIILDEKAAASETKEILSHLPSLRKQIEIL